MEYVTVAQEGFYGLYHVPVKDHDPKKVVIVVGGSEGNENIPMNVGAMFARCGIAALGICYWNVDGLPKELVRVPVDPFEKAAFQKVLNWYCFALLLCRISAALLPSPRFTVYGEACTGIKAWHRKLFHLPPNSHTGEKIFRV